MSLVLAIAGAGLVLTLWISWFRRIGRVAIPKDKTVFLGGNALGALLGIIGASSGPGWIGGIAAGVAILGGSTFVLLWALSGQAKNEAAVSVGQPVLEFAAHDDSGETFELGGLRGKPILLKFFRGHW